MIDLHLYLLCFSNAEKPNFGPLEGRLAGVEVMSLLQKQWFYKVLGDCDQMWPLRTAGWLAGWLAGSPGWLAGWLAGVLGGSPGWLAELQSGLAALWAKCGRKVTLCPLQLCIKLAGWPFHGAKI